MLRFLFLALLLPICAQAQIRTDAAYTVRISGITVGTLKLSGVETASGYSTAAAVDSAGAARVFREFRYRGKVQGAVARGRFVPIRYEEVADTGRRKSEAVLEYTGGVPRVTRYTSPRPDGPDTPAPSTQGGTLDPLSAMYAVLRDRPADRLCNETLYMFDGRRRSRVVLGAARAIQGGGFACAGEYRRMQGYTADELARHRAFPMTLVYQPGPTGLMRVARVELKSIYGPATLVRR